MALKIKVDEDLPGVIAEMARQAGYDAATVLDQGMGGAKDPALWKAVQGEGRFLITTDKGFGDIRRYPLGSHQGVLLLRPDQDGIMPLVDLFRLLLEQQRLDTMRGMLTVTTPRGIRIRKR